MNVGTLAWMGDSPLVLTKIDAPRLRPGHVPRGDLIERLRHGLHRRLNLVAAPAGWGKTTLLAEWITVEDELTFAWLTLDAHDNDPARFWSYVSAALRKADVDVPPAFEAAVAAPGTSTGHTALPVLINALVGSEQEHILVLDDYHLISEPEIHEGMRFLLQHLPLTSHLVIATRTEPPVDLSRLRARGELGEIVSDQLRFSDAEAAALLNDTLELALPAEEASRRSAPEPRAGRPGSTWPACRCATDRALPSPPTSGTTAIYAWITSATRCCRRRSGGTQVPRRHVRARPVLRGAL